MGEAKLQIITSENKGRQFKNLNLKTRVSGGDIIQGMPIGDYIVVEKVGFEEGRQIGAYPLYSCQVKYGDEECSIVLNENEHAVFKGLGAIGTKIRITALQEEYEYQGVKKKKTVLRLEKAD